MPRIIILCGVALAVALLEASPASAQLRIRAPFVQVDIGGGVHVRAPFVNIFVPARPRVVSVPPAPAPGFVGPPPAAIAPMPKADVKPKVDEPIEPAPGAPDDAKPRTAPPPPKAAATVMTIDEFTKSFQAKAGNYEVELINPVTKQPTTIRFTLPEGTPRKIHVSGREIEFDYGARRYVKIQFDADGAVVIAR